MSFSFVTNRRLTNQKHQNQSGQTIIEVLIGVLIVSIVMITLAAGLTLSIKSTAESKFKNLASSRAQEALEIYHRERNNLGWTRFREALTFGTICLNDLPADNDEFAALVAGECASGEVVAGTTFFREAIVTDVAADQVEVEIQVTWDDAGVERTVVAAQIFRDY